MKILCSLYLPAILLSMLCLTSLAHAYPLNYAAPSTQLIHTYVKNPIDEAFSREAHLPNTSWGFQKDPNLDICNCDFLNIEQHLKSMQPYHYWMNGMAVRLDFSDQKILNSWPVETIKVSEPTHYLFMLFGLGAILLARLRKKMAS